MRLGSSKYLRLSPLTGAAYGREWERMRAEELDAQGRTTRGTPRVRGKMVRYGDLIGLPPKLYNALRARRWRASRKMSLDKFLDRIAALLANGYEFLPEDLRIEARTLASQMATVKRHNRQRKVRVK